MSTNNQVPIAMPTNLILNAVNFTDASLTNGKTYSDGGGYACNYPLLNLDDTFSITSTLGSIYITTTDDFTILLGCDIQNNNVPVKKWLIGVTGQIFEIDYIISATRAALKDPSSYAVTGVNFYIIDYWGQPQVEETLLSNTDTLTPVGAGLVNTKIGPLTLAINFSQSIELGSEPISVDLGATASICEITVIYKT